MRHGRAGGSRRGRLRALARRFVPDHNPLRRPVDRFEAGVLAVLITGFLAGAPLAAMTAGSWSAAASQATQRAEAGWRPVRAVLLPDTRKPAQATFQSTAAEVSARWTAPDGRSRVGKIYVTGPTRPGRVVTIWTNRLGRVVGYPLQHSDVVVRTALGALLAVGVLAVLLGACWLLTRRVLDRRRLSSWDVSWGATGPQWTGRR